MLKKIKYMVGTILIFIGFFSPFAYAKTLCTFEIVNDAQPLPNGALPIAYLTHIDATDPRLNTHWVTSTLKPNGKIAITSDFGPPICDDKGRALLGPYVTLGTFWQDGNGMYQGKIYQGGLTENVTSLSSLFFGSWTSPTNNVVPLAPNP